MSTVPVSASESSERHASWLELFFDLVYVFAVAQLDAGLVAHADLAGGLVFVALFVPVWWAWVGFAFYVTRFRREDGLHRLLIFVAISASVALATSVHAAFAGRTAGFALAYAGVRLALVALYARAALRAPQGRDVAQFYVKAFGLGALVWLASALVPPPARFAVWALGLAVDVGAPLRARGLLAANPVDATHLPERFGLFVIIVLGEGVTVVGSSLVGLPLSARVVAAEALGVALVSAVWWTYFDVAAEFQGRALARAERSGTVARDVYSYGHFPIAVAITAMAAGTQLLLHHLAAPTDAAPARLALGVGAATFLLTMGVVNLALTRRVTHVATTRVCAALLAAGAAALPLPPLATIALVTAAVIGQAAILAPNAPQRRRGDHARTSPAPDADALSVSSE